MPNKKTVLLAQVFITLLMALLMSGIISMINMGPTAEWLSHWPLAFITAWPIAFILSIPVGKIAFAVAGRLTGVGQPA